MLFAGGSMLTSIFNQRSNNAAAMERQFQAENFNAQQAQEQRDWQERMSNTSHQREANDMQAAGLNRILAAGGGASTPSGSSASAPTPPAVQNNWEAGLNTALSAMKSVQELKNMKQTEYNIQMDSDKKQVEQTNVVADTAKKIAETSKTGDENKIVVQNLQKAIAEAMEAKVKQGYISSSAGGWLRTLSEGGSDLRKIISPITSAVSAVRGGVNISNDRMRANTFRERFGVE